MSSDRRSRRNVLAATVSGAAAAMMTGRRARAAEAAGGMKSVDAGQPLPAVLKVSLAGYSFRKDLDQPGKPGKMSLLDLVDLCARVGIDAVEPTSYYFLRTDDAFICALKRRTFLAGLEISGTPIRNNFCLPPGPELEKELAHVHEWVDICVKLGSPAIRIFAGRKPQDVPRDEVFSRVVNGIKQACAYAGSKGVFLAIENHGYMTETADDLLRLLDAVDSEWLGINLDTGNFREDPYGNIAKAAPHAITCQVKTQVVKSGTKEREPADFARIVDILRRARYRGYLALEYEGSDPHREVPEYLRKLLSLTRA